MPAADGVSYEGNGLPDLLIILTFSLSIIVYIFNTYKSNEVLFFLQTKSIYHWLWIRNVPERERVPEKSVYLCLRFFMMIFSV